MKKCLKFLSMEGCSLGGLVKPCHKNKLRKLLHRLTTPSIVSTPLRRGEFVAVLFAMLLTLTACDNKDAPAVDAKPTIKIGVILPLTGDSAFFGQPIQKLLTIGLSEIKQNKDLKYNYELIFDDSQNESKKANLNFHRLANINKIDAVMSLWSPAGKVISMANEEKYKIPHITSSWGYETAPGYYNMNHSGFAKEQIAILIPELNKNNISSLGLIWEADPSQVELVEILKEELEKNNIKVAFNNMITRGATDFRTEIYKMKQTDAQMIFMMLLQPSMGAFMKQKRELRYNIPLTTIEYFSYVPELFEGYWYVADANGSKEFAKYVKDKTGSSLMNGMGNLYDSLHLLINAFEVSSEDKPQSKEVIKNIFSYGDYKGVMGNIKIDNDGNIATQPVLKQIKNGKPVLVEEK